MATRKKTNTVPDPNIRVFAAKTKRTILEPKKVVEQEPTEDPAITKLKNKITELRREVHRLTTLVEEKNGTIAYWENKFEVYERSK